jgi:predicted molibdopterin-dependent oxidoreductase YjgC
LTNEELLTLKKLFKDALGCDNLDHSAGYAHKALTAGAFESLGYAGSPSVIADIQKAAMLLVVKTDAYETHPVIGFEINLAVKRKGADLRIVSDKKGKLSRLPDAKTSVHLPGTELLFFNALAKEILDANLHDAAAAQSIAGFAAWQKSLEGCSADQVAAKCGVTVDEIKTLAADYAKAESALILLPTGMGYPGHGKELAQAVINLALLTGRIGKEGSGVLIMGEKNNSQGAADLALFSGRGKDAAAILAGCASGSVKTLFIAGENPVVSYPNRKQVEAALDKVEFLVVQDLFLTETASKAQVVLPACSFAEKNGTFTSVGGAVQSVRRAVSPVGEARSDFEILNALHAAVTGQPVFASIEAAFNEIVATIPGYAGMSLGTLGDEGKVRGVSGSQAFVPVVAAAPAVEAGKLALVTGSALNHSGTLSVYGEGPMLVCPEGYVELNREDAKSAGVKDGDRVKVSSAAGDVQLKVKVGNRLPKGVVFAPYHFGESSINTVASGAAVTWVSISK